ncbi:hypothetical protein DM02DRAFT_650887 [Periconia macrospinosa]|uniref:Uncharacterized protein n=1 Tax=Periconia macrospinosa TaxID=97972 RepID=A0A2V1E439_9PLEO|nr:hypothetical protein DM02DRAFT_650887 [Periconia macrospinosa]
MPLAVLDISDPLALPAASRLSLSPSSRLSPQDRLRKSRVDFGIARSPRLASPRTGSVALQPPPLPAAIGQADDRFAVIAISSLTVSTATAAAT